MHTSILFSLLCMNLYMVVSNLLRTLIFVLSNKDHLTYHLTHTTVIPKYFLTLIRLHINYYAWFL